MKNKNLKKGIILISTARLLNKMIIKTFFEGWFEFTCRYEFTVGGGRGPK